MTQTLDRPTDHQGEETVAPPGPVVVPLAEPEELRRTSPRTRDDLLTLVGAAVGSLAMTWILYTKVFPFHGAIGFVVMAYVVFVVFYAGLTALTHPRQVVVDRIVTTAVIGAPTLVAVALASVVVMTFVKGMPALLHPNFFTEDMSGVGASDPFTKGGILHAIVGTLIEVAIAVSISMPLAVAAAVYMAEVGGRGGRMVRTVVEAMTALPSIVAGLFIYTICLVYLGMPASGLAAALALAVMALPIMARASYVVLGVVPGGLREASYALGAGKWQTVWRVVLPTARPGLATALILGIARAVGETAPVLLTSGASTYLNTNPTKDPMNSLPLFIYASIQTGNPQMEERAYAAAAVLLVLVLTLFVIARLVAGGRKSR